MSARQVRRVVESSQQSSDEEEEVEQTPRGNAFALLGASESEGESDETQTDVESSDTRSSDPLDLLGLSENESEAASVSLDELLAEMQTGDVHTDAAEETTAAPMIDPRHFNPDTELRRLFGPDAIPRQRHTKPVPGRKAIVSSARPSWPPLLPATLREVTLEDGRLQGSAAYRAKDRELELVQATMDPQAVQHFVMREPYHVGGLLLLHHILEQHGQAAEAHECVLRGIHRLECVCPRPLHAMTLPSEASTLQEQLHRLLALHLVDLARKGCPRTAMEVAKLMLAMDRTDPQHVLLYMDALALRSGEEEWLVEQTWELDENCAAKQCLPGMAFSEALCLYRLGRTVEAASACQRAVVLFPHMVEPLLHSIQSCAASWSWLKHRLFIDTRREPNEAVTRLVTLYVEMTASMWKQSHADDWLIQCCEAAVLQADDTAIQQHCATVAALYTPTSTFPYANILVSGDHITPAAEVARLRQNTPPSQTNPIMAFFHSLLPWNDS